MCFDCFLKRFESVIPWSDGGRSFQARRPAYENARLPISLSVRQRGLTYWAASADRRPDLIWLTTHHVGRVRRRDRCGLSATVTKAGRSVANRKLHNTIKYESIATGDVVKHPPWNKQISKRIPNGALLPMARVVSSKLDDGDIKGAVRLLCSDYSLAAKNQSTFDELGLLHRSTPADRRLTPSTVATQSFRCDSQDCLPVFPPLGQQLNQTVSDLLLGATTDNPI